MHAQSARISVKLSLRDLFPDALFVDCADIAITGISDDSRTLKTGDLFIARRGIQVDGRRFIKDAIHQGASAILSSSIEPDLKLPQCIVHEPHVAWGRICHALAGNSMNDISLVGITGTDGKTTTSLLTRNILRQHGHQCGLMGTLECHDGVTGTTTTMTTPSPPEIAHWVRSMRDQGTRHGIVEVSSHALCQQRLEGLSCDVAMITNITRDHLDYHGSRQAYIRSKERIFKYLNKNGTAILNLNDSQSAVSMTYQTSATITYGLEIDADIRGELLESSRHGQRFRLQIASEEATVKIPLVGTHNVSNCLGAAAVAHHYGIPMRTIVSGLETIGSIPGRLEHIESDVNFDVYVDYAHTSDALKRVLQSLRSLTKGRLICVFGAGGNRDSGKRQAMGHVVETLADIAVITTDNPRNEDPFAIIHDITQGITDKRQVHCEPDRRKAIQTSLQIASAGDIVLIAGKGHETYQMVGTTHLDFDDRKVVQEEILSLPSNSSPDNHSNRPMLEVI